MADFFFFSDLHSQQMNKECVCAMTTKRFCSLRQDITISYQLGQKAAQVDRLPPPFLIHHLHSPFLNLSLYHHLLLVLPPPPPPHHHQPFLFSSQL